MKKTMCGKETKKVRFFLFSFVFWFLLLGTSFTKAQETEWVLPGIDIISRAEWGANETRRLVTATGYLPILEAEKKQKAYMDKLRETDFDKWLEVKAKQYEEAKKNGTIASYLNTFWIDDYKVDKVITKMGNTDLWRPLQYYYAKKAIVIHHTADEAPIKEEQDEILQMQNIYKYHAFVRGWGDVGYNFVISPSGKIYEGRAGGPGVVGAHAKYNNNFTLGIALMGNFEKQRLGQAQRTALVRLLTALARRYEINPYATVVYHKANAVFPYIADVQGPTIVGHKDVGITACPGKYLYQELPSIIKEVAHNLGVSPSDDLQQPTVLSGMFQKLLEIGNTDETLGNASEMQKRIQLFGQKLKEAYVKNNKIHLATKTGEKVTYSPDIQTIQSRMGLPVRVLLYEASKMKEWKFSCSGCEVKMKIIPLLSGKYGENQDILQVIQALFPTATYDTGGNVVFALETNDALHLKKRKNLLYLMSGKTSVVPVLFVSLKAPENELITITNYKRRSYNGIPRNTFRGSLDIERTKIQNLRGIAKNEYGLINEVSLDDYMAGIVETNDTEPFEKNKLMALLAKNYMLFYIDKTNTHPNIPKEVSYNAIDDPRFFQKYVGAGAEKTLKVRPFAYKATKNTVLAYSGKLAFIPYFNCSAGFTRSAQEKRGWVDTPYLESKMDIGICPDGEFNGHGVGISGRGSTLMASKGMSYLDILHYYVPGVEAVDIK